MCVCFVYVCVCVCTHACMHACVCVLLEKGAGWLLVLQYLELQNQKQGRQPKAQSLTQPRGPALFAPCCLPAGSCCLYWDNITAPLVDWAVLAHQNKLFPAGLILDQCKKLKCCQLLQQSFPKSDSSKYSKKLVHVLVHLL